MNFKSIKEDIEFEESMKSELEDRREMIIKALRFSESEHCPDYLLEFRDSVIDDLLIYGEDRDFLRDLYSCYTGEELNYRDILLHSFTLYNPIVGSEIERCYGKHYPYEDICKLLFDWDYLIKLEEMIDKLRVIGDRYPNLVPYCASRINEVEYNSDSLKVSPELINTINMFMGFDSKQPIDTKELLRLEKMYREL